MTLWDLSGDNTIDSRDLVSRLEDINADLDDIANGDAPAGGDGRDIDDLVDEQKLLKDILETIEGYSDDPKYGVTLIAESYFETYAQEYAEEIGAIDRDPKWPYEHIDWKAAAEALQMDYTSVQIGTEDYWFR